MDRVLLKACLSTLFVLFGFWGEGSSWQLAAKDISGAGQEVEILSDKVYLYSYFNVLFKTPFGLEENVRISAVDPKPGSVLRTEKLNYSQYQTKDGRERRAFILGFYTIIPGLHQLPRFRFQNVGKNQIWQSPGIPFASFRVDEGALPLPVDVEINHLPKMVYVSQNIVLNVWAKRINTIDQSFLLQPPEFQNFLVQKSPIKPEVERHEILGKNVYQLSLGIWLLNPIEEGMLDIPAISATVMGLERQTLARQLEVLPLPPNPYQKTALKSGANLTEGAAIGQFEVSFRLLFPREQALLSRDTELQNSTPLLKDRPEFAKDELIHIGLRITGNGNIHLSPFPEIRAPSSLVLLQSDESESLKLDFDKAELFGWREKEFIYKAKRSGQYRVSVDSFHFFDPKQGRWRRTELQELTLQVLNLTTQPYYSNLEYLYFSGATVFFFNVMFWLQEYAFYICLMILFSTSIYFLLQVPELPLLDKLKIPYASYTQLLLPERLQAWLFERSRQNTRWSRVFLLLRNQYHRVLFFVLIFVLIWLSYSVSVANNRALWEETKQYYLTLLRSENIDLAPIKEQIQKLPYSPGHLPNISLWLYQNGLPLQALEMAYLNYFQLPLHPVSRRLVSSLRIQQGLDLNLPDFFFWPLQLSHIGRFLAIILCFIASLYCIYKKRYKPVESEELSYDNIDHLAQSRLLYIYRNYSIIVLLLLLSLSIPWRFALAVNTRADLLLEPIPPSEAASHLEIADDSKDKRNSWNNWLSVGELVKIKGRAHGSYLLVIGEQQDQGWLDEQELFLLSKY